METRLSPLCAKGRLKTLVNAVTRYTVNSHSTLKRHLWLFNSVLCVKGRLQVVFTITARDIYIPVFVEEVIKFAPTPLKQPNYFLAHW